jgi:predicted RNA-binding protein with PIN domain
MPYIIDGHNLIAAMPGIDLDDPQDEHTLLDRLQLFASREARQIFVYFDQGQTGIQNDFKLNRIHVRWIVPPRTADDAIRAHLIKIGPEGPNWVVVSSDREVLRQAEKVGARTLTSTAFVNQKLKPSDGPFRQEKPIQPLSQDEIDAWEALFRKGDNEI